MIKAVLVGLGNIAWKYDANNSQSSFALSQAGAMREHSGITLLGGCSPSEEDRKGFEVWSGGLPTFSSLEYMLQKLEPDLVGICSPTQEHFAHVCTCLDAGVHNFWLEKPPTLHLSELQELISRTQKTDVLFSVNYFRRYLPIYQNLRKILLNKYYGVCHNIHMFYSPGLARNGVHLLDLLFFLTNADNYELLWVDKIKGHSPSFALRLSTGQLVLANGVDAPYHSNDINVVCEHAVLSVLRGGKACHVEYSQENPLFPGFYDLHSHTSHPLGKAGIEHYMRYGLENLIYCITTREQPLSNLQSAYVSQHLLSDILEASR